MRTTMIQISKLWIQAFTEVLCPCTGTSKNSRFNSTLGFTIALFTEAFTEALFNQSINDLLKSKKSATRFYNSMQHVKILDTWLKVGDKSGRLYRHWQVIIELSPAIQWMAPQQWAQIYHMMGFMLLVPSKEHRSSAHDWVHINTKNLKV